jgi:hypothetical protein
MKDEGVAGYALRLLFLLLLIFFLILIFILIILSVLLANVEDGGSESDKD